MLLIYRKQFPKLFTYNNYRSFRESRIHRHLESSITPQLELNRLRNYKLIYLPTSNRKIHLYLGKVSIIIIEYVCIYNRTINCLRDKLI